MFDFLGVRGGTTVAVGFYTMGHPIGYPDTLIPFHAISWDPHRRSSSNTVCVEAAPSNAFQPGVSPSSAPFVFFLVSKSRERVDPTEPIPNPDILTL